MQRVTYDVDGWPEIELSEHEKTMIAHHATHEYWEKKGNKQYQEKKTEKNFRKDMIFLAIISVTSLAAFLLRYFL